MIITIDSGTTNTRIRLFEDRHVAINEPVEYKFIDEVRLNVGVRSSAITGSNLHIKKALKDSLNAILRKNNLKEKDISVILVSGMLSSDIGICQLDHVLAPVSCKDLSRHIAEVVIDDITTIPMAFITGVKNRGSCNSLDDVCSMDIMRGEETEIFGIMKMKNLSGTLLAVLPGSHTKLVEVDGAGRIVSCRTSISGELLGCISRNTILKHSLPEDLIEQIDEEYLAAGRECCKKYGLNSALFKVRLMDVFMNTTKQQAANFFVGVVLSNDIDMICEICSPSCSCESIIVGGSEPLRSAFYTLISREAGLPVIKIDDTTANLCTAYGAMYLWELYNNSCSIKARICN